MNAQRRVDDQVVGQAERIETVSNSTQDESTATAPVYLLPSLSLLAAGFWDELLKNGADLDLPFLRPDLGGW